MCLPCTVYGVRWTTYGVLCTVYSFCRTTDTCRVLSFWTCIRGFLWDLQFSQLFNFNIPKEDVLASWRFLGWILMNPTVQSVVQFQHPLARFSGFLAPLGLDSHEPYSSVSCSISISLSTICWPPGASWAGFSWTLQLSQLFNFSITLHLTPYTWTPYTVNCKRIRKMLTVNVGFLPTRVALCSIYIYISIKHI